MLFADSYKEISYDSVGYYKERDSRFVGYCYLVKTKKEIKEKLELVKKKENPLTITVLLMC